jgi:phosphoesterase RecJ-like protein
MALNRALIQQAHHLFQNARRVLIVSHIRPDGDSIGSLLGLGLALQAAGKQVWMVSEDGVPSNLRHLPGAEQVHHRPQGEFDLACCVDISDPSRAGEALQTYGQPDINIDHHITNLLYARVNLVDADAVATTQILADLMPEWGLSIGPEVASVLLSGLITDTLGFRTSNMTPHALRLTANLMEAGADLPELYRRGLITRSFEATRYWAAGLSRLEREGRLVWTALTLEDRKSAGYPGRDDADLVNVLSSIDDADVSVIFIEQPNERVKVSWRSQPGFDVSQIALQFGGGGHPAASGADVPGSLESVQAAVLAATRPLLREKA